MKNYSKNKKTRFGKKPLVITLSIVLLLALAGSIYAFVIHDGNKSEKNRDAPETINYDPPTKEEQEAGDTQKAENIERENNNSNNQSSSAVVLEASQYNDVVEIRAYVTGVFEDDGQCKITLRKDSSSITRTSTSFASATTTQCGAINIPISEFPSAGEWQATMEYSSSTTSGKSSTEKLVVSK